MDTWLSQYKAVIREQPFLDDSWFQRDLKGAREGDDVSRRRILGSSLRFVLEIVERGWRPDRGIDVIDLLQEANYVMETALWTSPRMVDTQLRVYTHPWRSINAASPTSAIPAAPVRQLLLGPSAVDRRQRPAGRRRAAGAPSCPAAVPFRRSVRAGRGVLRAPGLASHRSRKFTGQQWPRCSRPRSAPQGSDRCRGRTPGPLRRSSV